MTDPVMGDGLGQTEEFNPLRDPEKDEFSKHFICTRACIAI